MKEILVIDDHPVIIFSMERIVTANFPGYKVIPFSDSDSIINYVYNNNPSLVILDLNIDGVNPTDVLKNINMIKPDVPVLIFTSNPEETHGRFFLKAGAKGFLNKDAESEEIVRAISKVLDGKVYVSGNLAEIMATDLIEHKSGSILDRLSKREFEVMERLIRGLSPSEIVNEMNLKPQTVTTYKNNIFEKLGVKNIIELYEVVKLNKPLD